MGDLDRHFETRKRDHMRVALDPTVQSDRSTGLESVELIHEALPDLDFSEIDLQTSFAGAVFAAPFFVSSMTAGHAEGVGINRALARLSARRRLLMGVGSQRRELFDSTARDEWQVIRRETPDAFLAGNLGLAQVIGAPVSQIQALVDSLQAVALFIHLNPLQECLQPEGTPHYRGGLKAIGDLCAALSVPVIIKETGCGISAATIRRLKESGIAAVDVGGLGGTHWGRVEGRRAGADQLQGQAAPAFANWGIPTARAVHEALLESPSFEIWASGGVRDGVEIAKLLALGARQVGLAQPWLLAASKPDSDVALDALATRLEFELKTAMFCTGSRTPADLKGKWRCLI